VTDAVHPLLRRVMLVVDVGFLAYWAAISAGLVPPALLFDGYGDPVMQAWNWSFLPLDVAASLTGLWSLARLRAGDGTAMVVLGASLALTAAAGGMAISFWALRGWFDPVWWIPNLALLGVGAGGLVVIARPRTGGLAAAECGDTLAPSPAEPAGAP
jgi:hypothetical protein